MSSSIQPSCAETADPSESIDLESAQRICDVLRPNSEGLAAESEAAWRVSYAALRANALFWRPYHRSSAVWAFYRLKGEDMVVDVRETQKLRCWVCLPTEAESSNSSGRGTRSRKGILQYNPTHGFTSMKTHVENEHGQELARYVRESATEEGDTGRQKTKKRKGHRRLRSRPTLGMQSPTQRMMCNSNDFLKTWFCSSLRDTNPSVLWSQHGCGG